LSYKPLRNVPWEEKRELYAVPREQIWIKYLVPAVKKWPKERKE